MPDTVSWGSTELFNEPKILSKEPHTLFDYQALEGLHMIKQPYIQPKEPYIQPKEPYIQPKEPYILFDNLALEGLHRTRGVLHR